MAALTPRPPFLSASWHRVADLRPRLPPHAEVTRQRARGAAWYSVRNAATGRVHRCSPPVYLLIGLLDGHRTVAQAWAIAAERLQDAAPTQDEVIGLLTLLHEADLLQSDVTPDFAELLARRSRTARAEVTQRALNPISLRVPLLNPDRFLTRTLPLARPLFGAWGLLAWLVVIAAALVYAGVRWDELTNGAADRILASENLLVLALVFPLMKALHEMGHAYAVKAYGGDVHEMGVMLLVLLPIPYVDASAASGFRSRRRRVVVGAAGMLAETFAAALAMIVYAQIEPGAMRTVLFNVMLVAGFSTIVFNANPLLRYDGYFILSDLIEIPNLAQRATKFWGWLTYRFAFGLREPPPAATAGERAWFVTYAPAALVMRVVVMAGIVLVVAQKAFVLGVLVAAWTALAGLAMPALRACGAAFTAPALTPVRARARAVTLGAACVTGLLATLVPLPCHTVAEGVVWLPDDAVLRAAADGFAREILLPPGSAVTMRAALLRSEDPDLAATIAGGRARVRAVTAELAAEQFDDRVQAAITRRALAIEQAALDRAVLRDADLTAFSPRDGVFALPDPGDLAGRHHKRGDVLGYVLPDRLTTVRVLVGQDDAALVRTRTRGVAVRFAGADRGVPGTVIREVPQASEELPSRALTIEGGGAQATDPRDQSRAKTVSRNFQFDVAVAPGAAPGVAGAHAYVRFDHGPEPFLAQAARHARQLFLSHFAA